MTTDMTYDVAIVGGGAAGLSAAVALARSLRPVLVVDAGEPRNAPADGAHNVLARDGIPPLELLAAGRREAEHYGARIRHDRAVAARRHDGGFEVDLAGGGTVRARRLLLATGLVDELPDIPGVRELWGKSVLHCPYCHGWEVRGQRIGVLGTSLLNVHQALLFRQLSEDVTLFAHRMPAPDGDARARLAALDIRVVNGAVARLRVDDGVLRAVVLDDTREFGVDVVTVAPRFVARSDLYEQLGGTLTEHPAGAFIATDPTGRTEIPGVWAAGNSSDLSAMVAAATGAGVMAATAVNADLVAEDAAAAVEARAAR
ncbi:NAD(P)/FAD-dependent oxidoreductase [Microbispora sp. NEAU-D428]|uniref:NAD(P)/FAD-dependent oxidoreductase n=1 Tax=Microbispora sitophila TaxID=2771537 RepID=UPI00186750BE|nr:NAD(P)/FAD-dependent oxidoreductase [Microbispora sitophila]MBE3014409.1 NAD(P)/FAD-dependent oxidoreductase [Microbispora sitophila]